MTRLAKVAMVVLAVAGLMGGIRKLWRLADPDASEYGHPALPSGRGR